MADAVFPSEFMAIMGSGPSGSPSQGCQGLTENGVSSISEVLRKGGLLKRKVCRIYHNHKTTLGFYAYN